jgi:DUF4097 and DUF4098 domain-containing protein YvlB
MSGSGSFTFRKRTNGAPRELGANRNVIGIKLLAESSKWHLRCFVGGGIGMRKIFASAAIMAAVVLLGTPPAHSQSRGIEGSFVRTLNVSGGVNLDVSTGSGSIDIRRGSGNTVEVRGRIRAGTDRSRSDRDAQDVVRELESNPPIEQSGSTIRIGRDRNNNEQRNVSISYEIVVPPDTAVRAHTGSGSQNISGLSRGLEVGTGSGSLTLADLQGHIDASTGSGSIRASNVRGSVRMHTGSGGIDIQGEQTGAWSLETGSGGIAVRLPRTANFDLNAHTGSGGVYVDFPMTVQGRLDNDRRDVRGAVGSGGHALTARTGSGRIRIE